MPRKSRAASKSKDGEDTAERVTRTSLRSRSRGGAAASVEPPKVNSRKASPSPSTRRGARSRSTKAVKPEKASPAKGRAAKRTAAKEEPLPARGRAAAKKGGRAASKSKAVEEAEENVEEEVSDEEEEKPAESPAKGRGRARSAKKSEEPAVEKSPAPGRAARGRRSGAAETTEGPTEDAEPAVERSPAPGRATRGRRSGAGETSEGLKEEAKAEGGRPSRRSTAAEKSSENPAPSLSKRRSRGEAVGTTVEAVVMETEPALAVEKSPERALKLSPKRRGRGKSAEPNVEQKETEAEVEAATVSALKDEAPKEQITDATTASESVEMKTVPAPEVPSTAALPADSPSKKRKREEDNEEIGSSPKKSKLSPKDELPAVVPLVEDEAMETSEPEGASVVDSSSAAKKTKPPVLDAAAAKEAEAVPTPEEAPVPPRVRSNTDMTEPPTSSHGVISSFPAETEQLTPEAEPAEADYELLPTPPEQDMTGEEPDQSDECAPAVPAPMPETREAEHIHEAKDTTPVATTAPVAATEPVQSSQEVKRNLTKPTAPKEHEPDQSSSVRPVRQAMETDLSSGSAEACSVPVQAPEVVEPVIVPERAQMLYDSSSAPSSSSPQVRVEAEAQGSGNAEACSVPVQAPEVVEPVIVPERAQMLYDSSSAPSSSSPQVRVEAEVQGSEAEAMEVEQTPAVPPVSSTMEADSGANSTSGQQTDVASDYVHINMADVPPSDSAEVKQCLPREHLAAESEQKSSSGSVQVSSTHTTPANPPLMNNHQDTHSNTVDAMNGHSTPKDLLLNRKYIQNVAIDSSTLDPAKQFSVVSYNILAECHRKRGDYSHAAEEVLEQGYRHSRLMLELQYLDADVVCLQEVDPDYYKNTLEPALRALGYSGEYKKRVDDYYHEGGATFYRSSRFSLVECSSIAFRDAVGKDLAVSPLREEEKAAVRNYVKDPSIVLLTKLKCNTTGKEVTVGNIHVAYADYRHPDLQCVQIAYAVNRLVAMAGGLQNAHILCGDFNCESTWPPFQLARDGYLTNEMIEKLQAMESIELPDGQKKSLVNLFWKGFQHTSPNLQSAYSIVMAKEPALTSVTAHNRRCLDYIFCSNGDFNILGVLETHTEATMTINSRLPSIVFPSDHVSMKARLAFK